MTFHRLSLLVSLLVSFFLIINYAYAKKLPVGYPECWQDTKNPIILNIKSSDQFCPLNSKLGHKFFLVDFTSPLKQPQIDWISGRIFGNALVKDTPPYHKVSYMKIDNTAPQSQVISYSKCRFKTGNKSKFDGEQTNTGCEGEKQIAEVYTAWTALTNKFEKEFLHLNHKEGQRSLIFEYLFHVLRESKTDFTFEYPERELVIVSDLMQHSDRFSFYRHCKTNLELKKPNKCRTFEKLLKNKKVKNYIDDRKPKKETLTNLKVTVLYINHDYETRDGLSSSLVTLWEDLFKYIGVTNYEIIKQLDIK
tara:strand:- start:1010 stop:1930 length:921 start_codon:yes stop_codon:yes gene_type:complete